MKQEALLPGTDAILKGTIEVSPYRGHWLVRYKRPDGMVFRRQFKDPAEAHAQMLEWMEDLAPQARPQL